MVDNEKLRFGYNFKRLCKEHNIAIAKIADTAGIPRTTLYNIAERGTDKPRGDVIEKVIKAMQKEVPTLTRGDFLPVYDEEEDTYSVEALNYDDFVPVAVEITTDDAELHQYLQIMGDILQRLTPDGKIEAVGRVEKLLKNPKYSKV